MRITTGSDDLRGGNDNLSVQIHFADGSMQSANNVNKGANWGNNSVNFVSLSLNKPVAPGQIKDITLIHGAQGGYTPPQGSGITSLGTVAAPIALANGVKSEDNWDMAEFQAFARKVNAPIASFGLHRFTGSDPSLDIHTQPGAECPTGREISHKNFFHL